MKTLRQGRGAFTLVELLAVMAIVSILAGLLVPAVCRTQARARRVVCLSHLHQMGLGFLSFLNDHNDGFPMDVSTNAGGTYEFLAAAGRSGYLSYVHFQALSNDLATPAIFACPADPARAAANDFSALNNRNLSYFVGVNADYAQPNSILAGDRNLMSHTPTRSSAFIRLNDDNPARWTRDLHGFKGNQLFADGRAERANGPALKLSRRNAPAVMDLLLPAVKPSRPAPSSLAYGYGQTPVNPQTQ